MSKKKEIRLTPDSTRIVNNIPEVSYLVEHNFGLDTEVELDMVGFYVGMPFLAAKGELKRIAFLGFNKDNIGDAIERFYGGPVFTFPKVFPKNGIGLSSVPASPIFSELTNILTNYKPTKTELKKLRKLWYPEVDQEIYDHLGDIIKKMLKGVGYTVILVPAKPKYFYAPTADHVTQRIYTADKRGNVLADLMNIRKDSTIPIFENPLNPQSVIGLKIDISIPSERADKKLVQLHFDFDFQQKDGFKIIPVKDIQKPETQSKINKLLQEIERKISKDLDPLTLRVKDAVLCLSQDKASRKFSYTESELMNLLYVKEKRKGGGEYHGTKNKGRVRERLQLISKMKLTYAIRIDNETIGVEDIPHIILNPEGKPFIEYRKGRKKKRFNFQSIEIPERYWNLFYGGKYVGQYTREALKLKDSDYLLYKYLATQWRIGWIKYKGVYTWYLSEILTAAGVKPPTPRHRARFIKKLKESFDRMKRSKLIGSYKCLDKNRDPVADRWRFEAPKELKDQFEQIGVEHRQNQEIKKLKAKKKKLKLESDIIELKKTVNPDA